MQSVRTVEHVPIFFKNSQVDKCNPCKENSWPFKHFPKLFKAVFFFRTDEFVPITRDQRCKKGQNWLRTKLTVSKVGSGFRCAFPCWVHVLSNQARNSTWDSNPFPKVSVCERMLVGPHTLELEVPCLVAGLARIYRASVMYLNLARTFAMTFRKNWCVQVSLCVANTCRLPCTPSLLSPCARRRHVWFWARHLRNHTVCKPVRKQEKKQRRQFDSIDWPFDQLFCKHDQHNVTVKSAVYFNSIQRSWPNYKHVWAGQQIIDHFDCWRFNATTTQTKI